MNQSVSYPVPAPKIADGALAVVKLGGRSFESPEGRAKLAAAIARLVKAEAHVVVVHGGGKQVTQAMEAAGLAATFVGGLRVTTPEALAIAEPVLTTLGKELAHALTLAGAPAIGLTGRDARVVTAVVKDPALGRVGTVTAVEADVLRFLYFNGLTPVVAPLALADDSGMLNVNADEVAAAVARALGAKHLVLLTDVEGVKGSQGNVIASLTPTAARALVHDGTIKGGMVPKVVGALDALAGGVKHVHVLSGERPDALDALARGETVGTTFTGETP